MDSVSDDATSEPLMDSPMNDITVSRITPKPLKSTLSQNQKYKKTMEIGQKIAGSACQVGMHDFREKFHLL